MGLYGFEWEIRSTERGVQGGAEQAITNININRRSL